MRKPDDSRLGHALASPLGCRQHDQPPGQPARSRLVVDRRQRQHGQVGRHHPGGGALRDPLRPGRSGRRRGTGRPCRRRAAGRARRRRPGTPRRATRRPAVRRSAARRPGPARPAPAPRRRGPARRARCRPGSRPTPGRARRGWCRPAGRGRRSSTATTSGGGGRSSCRPATTATAGQQRGDRPATRQHHTAYGASPARELRTVEHPTTVGRAGRAARPPSTGLVS